MDGCNFQYSCSPKRGSPLHAFLFPRFFLTEFVKLMVVTYLPVPNLVDDMHASSNLEATDCETDDEQLSERWALVNLFFSSSWPLGDFARLTIEQ
jgi:hypothetical protein